MKFCGCNVLLCAGALLVGGCSKPSIPALPSNSLLSQPVPAKSVAVVFVDWTRVANDDYFKDLVKKEELDKALRAASIDPDSVSAMIIFSDIAEQAKICAGAILMGSFDANCVAAAAQAKGWVEERYLDYSLYSNQEGDWLAILKSGCMVLGTKVAVLETLDVEAGRKPSFLAVDPFDRIVTRIAQEPQAISMVVSIPQAVRDAAGAVLDIIGEVVDEHQLGPLAKLLEKVCLAKGLSFSMSRQENTLFAKMAVVMSDQKAARLLSGTLNLLKGLTKLVPKEGLAEIDDATKQAFQSLAVQRDREIVTVEMAIPESAIGVGTPASVLAEGRVYGFSPGGSGRTHNADQNASPAELQTPWRFAILTDLHIGRDYSPYEKQEYYLTKRLRNVIKWLKDNRQAKNIKFLAVLGDISDTGAAAELEKAKEILDGLNEVGLPYFCLRGNHDRDLETFCRVFSDGYLKAQGDLLGIVLQSDFTKHYNYAFAYDGIGFLFMDFLSSGLRGAIDAADFEPDHKRCFEKWLNRDLCTVIFSHHPMIKSDAYAFLQSDIENIFYALENWRPFVFANFAGHIHGYYDKNKIFRPVEIDLRDGIGGLELLAVGCSPVFMNANFEYGAPHYHTPAPLVEHVIGTEALLVGSNEPEVKGFIRLVTVQQGRITRYDELHCPPECERCLNPVLAAVPMQKIRSAVRTGMVVPSERVQFRAYAFSKLSETSPFRCEAKFADGELFSKGDMTWKGPYEFERTYRQRRPIPKVESPLFQVWWRDTNGSVSEWIQPTIPIK